MRASLRAELGMGKEETGKRTQDIVTNSLFGDCFPASPQSNNNFRLNRIGKSIPVAN
jgi:hypothetical protein